tara:strand:+ start:9586 stop:10176 length:591 start_codon:yes stop_codon:yes gene_type:complete
MRNQSLTGEGSVADSSGVANSIRHSHATAGDSAFTLVEVIAVTVILAMFAAAAMLTVRDSLKEAGRTLFVDRLHTIDNQLRIQAGKQHTGTVVLILDLDSHRLSKINQSAGETILATEIPVDRVSAGHRIVQTGRVSIQYRPDGSSTSFAVRIVTGKTPARWLFVAGGTGQTLEYENDEEIEALLMLPQTTRSYAR